MKTEKTETQKIQKTDKAHETAHAVDLALQELLQAEAALETGYAHFGALLLEVQINKYWEYLGFDSFGKYMANLSKSYHKGRSQLYHYLGTVRELKPYVSEEQLGQMGISKAAELKNAAHIGKLSTELIQKAIDPDVTVKDIRKLLFDATDDGPKDNKGSWLDLEAAFYCSEEEKKVIESAILAAQRTDVPTPQDYKPWQRIKDVILKWSMEYLAIYSHLL